MPSLKEIKTRIASVNSTRKITSAMKMVASSKLHHAQVAIQNMLPYENLLEHILKSFLVATPEVDLPHCKSHESIHTVALVVFTSNSSLCGGFNNNTIKLMLSRIEYYKSQGVKSFVVYPIGRKVEEKVNKLGLHSAGSFTLLADKPNSEGCIKIAHELENDFLNGKIDKVELIYHHFKSVGSQILSCRTFLPIDLTPDSIGSENDRILGDNKMTVKAQEYLRNKKGQQTGNNEHVALNDDFIVEPDKNTLLEKLVPKQLHLMIYTALLDSVASEHAARMIAMQTATDNADAMLKDLNLEYNKSRQAAITSELLDIVSGSVNN
jgi:F-type H+-transporting ATPase subunit gamma